MLQTSKDFGLLLIVYGTAWIVMYFRNRWARPLVENAGPSDHRSYSIDGLRGLLALGVMTHHLLVTRNFMATHRWESPPGIFVGQLGQACVAIFFMITAFLFGERLLKQRGALNWKAFYVSRICRLTPLYLVVVALVVSSTLLVQGGRLVQPPGELLKGLGAWLLFTIPGAPDLNDVPGTFFIIAGVTWTLRYEWAFYIGLPVLAWVISRGRYWLAGALSIIGLSLFWRLARIEPLQLLGFHAFAGGIVAAMWLTQPRWVALARRRSFGMLAVVCLCFVFFTQPSAFATHSLVALTIFFIAAAAENPVTRLLAQQTARALGEISYGVYLLHGFFLWLLRKWLPHFIDTVNISDLRFLGWAIGMTMLVVAVTTGLHLWIERPGIIWGRRLQQCLIKTHQ